MEFTYSMSTPVSVLMAQKPSWQQTMLRIKDPKRSLAFYQVREREDEEEGWKDVARAHAKELEIPIGVICLIYKSSRRCSDKICESCGMSWPWALR